MIGLWYSLSGFCSKPEKFESFFDVETGEAIALGFQHYILALGTAVMIPSFLVPLMGGTDVSLFILRLKWLSFGFEFMIL